MKFTRKENGVTANTNAKKGIILKLLSAHARYIRRKIRGIYRKLVEKNPQIIMAGSRKMSQNGLIN